MQPVLRITLSHRSSCPAARSSRVHRASGSRRSRLAQSIALACMLLFSKGASADDGRQLRHDGTEIPVCVGWDPERRQFGSERMTAFADNLLIARFRCPKGFGIISAETPYGPEREGAMIPLVGDCCPLPPDALLDEPPSEHTVHCPNDSIVVGGRMQTQGADPWWNQSFFMHCARINTARYRLGPDTPGMRVGPTMSYSNELLFSLFGMKSTRLSFLSVPAGIRYAVGRLSATEWKAESCIGSPFGSVAVGKTGKECRAQHYRQLLYRGIKGDPADGTPVRIFADCEAIDDPLSTTPRCIPAAGSR